LWASRRVEGWFEWSLVRRSRLLLRVGRAWKQEEEMLGVRGGRRALRSLHEVLSFRSTCNLVYIYKMLL
jgi:hypothetical protein